MHRPVLEPQERARRSGWRGVLAGAAVCVAVAALYAPATRLGLVYDDHRLLMAPAAGSAAELGERFVDHFARRDPAWHLPYYRPLPRFSYVAQQALFGNEPAPFHAFNALLTAAAAVLAYGLLRLPVFGIRPLPALLGAVLFGVHPVASSCAYPISARETLMPAVFVIASVQAFLRPGVRGYTAAIVLFAGALLCKEQAVVVPALFVLADALGLSADAPGRSVRGWLRRYAPVALVLVAYAGVRAVVIGTVQHPLAVLDAPLGPLLTLLFSLQTIFTPFVELVYEPRLEVWWSWWRQLVVAIVLVALGLAARGRWGELWRPLLFWIGWFLLSLAPMANLLVQEAHFAERYGLLAMLGAVGAVAGLASRAWERAVVRRSVVAVAVIAVLACGAISGQRARYYASDHAFLEQWLRTDPESVQALVSLGELLVHEERVEEAIGHFRRAVETGRGAFPAHSSLGRALALQRRYPEAIRHQRRALRFEPDSVEARVDLAGSLRATGALDEAVGHYRRALALDPDHVVAHVRLAVTLSEQGKRDDAIREYQRVLELEPDFATIHRRLGLLLLTADRRDEATAHLRRAAQLDPRLGERLERRGLLGDAGEAGPTPR